MQISPEKFSYVEPARKPDVQRYTHFILLFRLIANLTHDLRICDGRSLNGNICLNTLWYKRFLNT